MKSIKKKVASLMMIAMFLATGNVFAQQDILQQRQQKEYSGEEIDLFAEALVEALPVQREAEKKMIKEIEEQGMELNQFNTIARQMQQGNQLQGVSEEDMETFKSISKEIQKIQMDTQRKVNKIVTDAGINPALYQEMIGAYSTNPKIKQKVDQKLAEEGQQ
ncbi:DUF4168 domain-containing protein [Anaerophaga thermohalophila]|uniref:DUF4168 domain-containing protein n=1 Tax=Anaerophaga thermohalophila TaxID=177400 RepID=UPI000300FAE5|nr:DUF4168 domain-containing protein [Anaerophaga thermohalophila]